MLQDPNGQGDDGQEQKQAGNSQNPPRLLPQGSVKGVDQAEAGQDDQEAVTQEGKNIDCHSAPQN